jgi:hypothetical protein
MERLAMQMRCLIGGVLLALLSSQAPARADRVEIEKGDAGQLPSTAQALVDTTGELLTAITGAISAAKDVDMFLIHIFDPKAFSATTVGTGGTLSDTQLFLFDFSGHGVYANDDQAISPSLRSRLPANHALAPKDPGYYYLAISAHDVDPADIAGKLIFNSFPTNAVAGPNAGVSDVADWVGSAPIATAGTYQINLTGVGQIPEPGAWILASIAALGVWIYSRGRRRLAM